MKLRFFGIAFLILTTWAAKAQQEVINGQGEKIIVLKDGSWKYADESKNPPANGNKKAKAKKAPKQSAQTKEELSKPSKNKAAKEGKAPKVGEGTLVPASEVEGTEASANKTPQKEKNKGKAPAKAKEAPKKTEKPAKVPKAKAPAKPKAEKAPAAPKEKPTKTKPAKTPAKSKEAKPAKAKPEQKKEEKKEAPAGEEVAVFGRKKNKPKEEPKPVKAPKTAKQPKQAKEKPVKNKPADEAPAEAEPAAQPQPKAGKPKTPKTKAPKSKGKTVVKAAPVEEDKLVLKKESPNAKAPVGNDLDLFGDAANPRPEPRVPQLPTPSDRWKTPVAPRVLPYPYMEQCEFAYNEVDEFTAKPRKGLKEDLFFAYTRKEDREFLREKDFLECFAAIISEDKELFLSLSYTMDSPYGRSEYGYVEAGAPLEILFVNGEHLKLLALKPDKGRVNANKKTVYKTTYLIDSKVRKMLARMEIDKIRMSWSVGVEDYEVYDVDFLIRKLKCFE